MRRIELDISKIRKKYLDQHLGTTQIALTCKSKTSTIRRRLREMGIPIERRVSDRVDIPEVKLRELYIDAHLGRGKIADIYGCAPSTILRRLKRAGISRRTIGDYQGQYANNWRGEQSSANGYIQLRDTEDPRADSRGYVYEHIKVWEQVHARPLPKGWVIHHLNGIRDDNRPSNLAAMPREKHFILIKTYKQHIRELEAEIAQLKRALESNQMIFYTDN